MAGFTGSIAIRGIRGPIPSGYVLGRTDSGSGPPQLVSWAGIGQKLMGSGVPVTRLSALQDVALSTLTNKQHLEYNSAAGKWVNVAAPALATLTDVDTTGLTTGQGLQYNGTKWVPHTHLLSDDGDVAISSPTNLQVLQYNSGTSKWANATISVSATLAGLTDVQLTSLADAQILQYNASSSKWKNVSGFGPSVFVLDLSLSTNTSMPGGTWTKCPFDTVVVDTQSAYSLSTHKWTPTVAGLYILIFNSDVDTPSANSWGGAAFQKNGVFNVVNLVGTATGGPPSSIIEATAIVSMNGSTDYIEFFSFGGTTQIASNTIARAVLLAGSSAAGSATLAGDTDVVIASPANNDLLTYETSSGKWKNKPAPAGGSTTLAGDTDVAIASPAAGDMLRYNAGTSKWENYVARRWSYPSMVGGTQNSSFAMKGNSICVMHNIIVDKISAIINATSGQTYSVFIGTLTGTGSAATIATTVVTATARFTAVATGFQTIEFSITPTTLTAGQMYIIAAVCTSGAAGTSLPIGSVASSAYPDMAMDQGQIAKQWNTFGVGSVIFAYSSVSDTPSALGIGGATGGSVCIGIRWRDA